MNTNNKWTKSISVALLAALAVFATTGLVLADHLAPAEGVPVSSQTYFDQYQAAIDHMEEDRDLAVTAFLNRTNIASHDTFRPGSISALKQLERDLESASMSNVTDMRRLNALTQGYNARIQLNRTNIRRLGALSQSYNARIQLEQDRNAGFEKTLVYHSGDSWFLIEHFSEFGR